MKPRLTKKPCVDSLSGFSEDFMPERTRAPFFAAKQSTSSIIYLKGRNTVNTFRMDVALSLWAYSLREFVQVCIEGKKVGIVRDGLGAQDTVNYVEALLSKQGQSPDKLLLIIICNSLIVQDIN